MKGRCVSGTHLQTAHQWGGRDRWGGSDTDGRDREQSSTSLSRPLGPA